MWKLIYKGRKTGFTIIELLVTIAVICVLASIATVTVGKIRSAKDQTTCIKNLRGISQGLQLYYNDFMVFPDDGYPDNALDTLPLSTELANYISTKSTFICPADNDPTSKGNYASYDSYYVARKDSYGSDELVIGCPRHRGAKNSTSVFTSGSTEITSVCKVMANGQEIPPDGTTALRKISNVNDKMTFDDLSTFVKITSATGGSYGCFLVQSVRLSDGTLYSIVKVQDNGTIDVQVTSGSKFEIVTPSAIVGVRGTRFTVTTADLGFTTKVILTEGTVVLMNRDTGEITILTEGGTTECTVVANNEDEDNDGYSENQGDCDDTNVAIFTGVTDIPDNSIDEDYTGQDATTDPYDVDDDSDGYSENQGDCDDADSSVNPGMTERPYNGKDDDCNLATPDNDLDGDGYIGGKYGVDCDDSNPDINPGTTEIPDNGVDDDCNPETVDSSDDNSN